MRYIELDAVSIKRTLQEWQSAKPTGEVFALLPEAEKAQLPLLQTLCRNHGIARLARLPWINRAAAQTTPPDRRCRI
jgi:hypothetical protein